MTSIDIQERSGLRLTHSRHSFAPVPAGLQVDQDVDIRADDPALVDGRRICIATSRAGLRCRASAARGELLCNAHSGRLDSRAGGKARATKLRRQQEAADERAVLSRLGTRAVVAQALLEKNEQVAAAVRLLADDAADERAPHAQRLKSAQALIPWLNQALGTPTERVEHKIPGSLEELESLDTEQLEALVARGRARRLASKNARSDAASDVGSGVVVRSDHEVTS